MAKPTFSKRMLACAVSSAVGTLATAQDSPETNAQQVTVTAQKREQLLIDVPLAIQAFTGESLRSSGVAELGELIRYIPGASQGISNSYGYQTYQIRGTGVVTGDSTIAYYLDEAAFSLIGSNIAPVGRTFDLNRIEVLRGPQGTLYGLSALGGAIRFITADPNLSRIEARSQIGYSRTSGGDSGHFGDVALSVPIVEGKLAGRIAVDYERKGGYIEVTDFPDRENLDPVRIRNYRGKLLWQPTDAVSAKLTLQHNEVHQDSSTLLVSNDPPFGTQGTASGLAAITTKYDLAAAAISLDLGPGRLESSTGYLTFNLEQTAFINIGGPVQAVQASEQPTFTQELRYVSNAGGPIDWVAGGFYKRAKGDASFDLSGAVNVSLPSKSTAENYAVFAEASANLMGGKLIPLVGVRYSWDDRTTEAGGITQAAKFKSFTPRLNVSYAPARNQLVFVNIARGYRGGLFNNPSLVPLAQGLGVPAQNAVNPDSLWSYELGFKGSLFGGRLSYDVAAYHTTWKDVQIIVAPQPGLGVTVNAGRALGNGLDYGLSLQVIRGVSVSLTGNFNNTRLSRLPQFVADTSATDGLFNGARMPYVPRSTNTLSANVDQPIRERLRFVGYAAYSYAAGQNQANSGLTSDSIRLVSARVGVRQDKVSLLLFGDNLGNETGRTYREFGLLNRPYPRTVGVQLNVDY